MVRVMVFVIPASLPLTKKRDCTVFMLVGRSPHVCCPLRVGPKIVPCVGSGAVNFCQSSTFVWLLFQHLGEIIPHISVPSRCLLKSCQRVQSNSGWRCPISVTRQAREHTSFPKTTQILLLRLSGSLFLFFLALLWVGMLQSSCSIEIIKKKLDATRREPLTRLSARFLSFSNNGYLNCKVIQSVCARRSHTPREKHTHTDTHTTKKKKKALDCSWKQTKLT